MTRRDSRPFHRAIRSAVTRARAHVRAGGHERATGISGQSCRTRSWRRVRVETHEWEEASSMPRRRVLTAAISVFAMAAMALAALLAAGLVAVPGAGAQSGSGVG